MYAQIYRGQQFGLFYCFDTLYNRFDIELLKLLCEGLKRHALGFFYVDIVYQAFINLHDVYWKLLQASQIARFNAKVVKRDFVTHFTQ